MARALLVLLTIFMCAEGAVAQEIFSRDRATIHVSPAFPEAGTPLSLSVKTISTPLEQAYIRWFVDGALIAEGDGMSEAIAETKGLGTQTTISVEVLSNNVLLTATRTIQPAQVDIVWESNSYIPPLYRGRPLASPGTVIKAEAIPRLIRTDGSLIPTKDIMFTWRKNDAVVSSVSGRGKNRIVLPAPELFGSDSVSVEASSLDDSLIAAAQIVVPSQDPFVLLYQDHPLFGSLLHRALTSETTFTDLEVTLTAVPFFSLASSADDSRLEYAWSVNGATVPTDATSPSRIIINAERSSGTARLALSVTHSANYLMDAVGTWRLIFAETAGARGGSGLFAQPE